MTRRRIVGLDALRCIAIALIVVYHCFPNVLTGGFLAVELFFVVSGFLMGQKLIRLNRREGARFGGLKSFGRFLWGRLKRFWPMLLFCMILTLSLAYFADLDLLTAARPNSLYAVTFSTNIMSIVNGSTYENSLIPNLFNQTWFLALELQLCIVSFLMVAGFFRLLPVEKGNSSKRYWQLMVVCLGLAVMSFGLMGVYGGWFGLRDRAYFGIDSHAGAFLLGVGMAAFTFARKMRPTKKSLRWIWMVVFGLSLGGMVAMMPFVVYDSTETFIWGLPGTAALSVLMMIAILKLQRFYKKEVAWPMRALEYMGSLSFGVYLLHYGLNILLLDLMGFCSREVVPYIAIGVSVGLAVVLRQVIVSFSQKHKRWFYVLVAGSLVLPILALAKAPEKSTIELNLMEAHAEKEEMVVTEEEASAVDYTGMVELGNLLNGEVMKYFDATEVYAKPYPATTGGVWAVGGTTSMAGRAYYNTPLNDVGYRFLRDNHGRHDGFRGRLHNRCFFLCRGLHILRGLDFFRFRIFFHFQLLRNNRLLCHRQLGIRLGNILPTLTTARQKSGQQCCRQQEAIYLIVGIPVSHGRFPP